MSHRTSSLFNLGMIIVLGGGAVAGCAPFVRPVSATPTPENASPEKLALYNNATSIDCSPFTLNDMKPLPVENEYLGKSSAIYYARIGQKEIGINWDKVWDKIKQINLPEEYVQQFFNAIYFHQECAYRSVTQTSVLFETPVSIPAVNKYYKEEFESQNPVDYAKYYEGSFLGVKGGDLILRTREDKLIMRNNLSELLANYFMWHNDYVPDRDSIISIAGALLPNYQYFFTARTLSQHIDLKKVFDLLQGDESSVNEAWKMMLLGHDVKDVNEHGIPFALIATDLMNNDSPGTLGVSWEDYSASLTGVGVK
jgi:hypothetical protein